MQGAGGQQEEGGNSERVCRDRGGERPLQNVRHRPAESASGTPGDSEAVKETEIGERTPGGVDKGEEAETADPDARFRRERPEPAGKSPECPGGGGMGGQDVQTGGWHVHTVRKWRENGKSP